MATVAAPVEQRLRLDGVSWQTYENLLKDLEGRRLRVTYDRGSLEIMTLSHGHEYYKMLLGNFICLLTLELGIPIHSGGSTTFRRKARRRGLEPDQCYWVEHEPQMRGKKVFDIAVDPPPDLAIEVDISQSSLPRMAIYATLGIGEVWRYDGQTLRVYHLTTGSKYRVRSESSVFPFLPMNQLTPFLEASNRQDETSLLQSFLAWVRQEVRPAYQRLSAKPGRRNGRTKGNS
jgi:Uma2 family endonuclease